MAEMLEQEDNLALQVEEVEALRAIYGEEWKVEDSSGNSYSIEIRHKSAEHSVVLKVILPPEYPLHSPPLYQFSAPWMKGYQKVELSTALEDIYFNHSGESILFMWIDKIRDYLDIWDTCGNNIQDTSESIAEEYVDFNFEKYKNGGSSQQKCSDFETPRIYHGETIVDRKSTFQAHLAPVVCVEQVQQIKTKLMENRKIASATHNILAYRIYIEDTKSFHQDCDDDGETHAGSRLLHLLEILGAQNVVVVVSRWYGGILLGPDRFKHINNAARIVLQHCGYITDQKSGTDPKGKKKKTR
ncbi:protein IMPACT-like [Limulus polyphemus]|uniref:Protein IMPACT-like n=1 Tax=Limulus polyphemus TaxID=6850 RepID=A0ABM1BT94_LIMPO|nr:protein IMPACT-like [Limulus polyphemus]